MSEAEELFAALETVTEPVVFCFPNADAGHQPIIERARDFCRRHSQARLNTNLDLFDFWGLLQQAEMMIGNSSSGIMETPRRWSCRLSISDRASAAGNGPPTWST